MKFFHGKADISLDYLNIQNTYLCKANKLSGKKIYLSLTLYF